MFGVGTVILTCCGGKEMDTSKVDRLMSCTLFVLAACVANIVVLEFGEWWLLYNEDLQYVISLHQMEELAFYGIFFFGKLISIPLTRKRPCM